MKNYFLLFNNKGMKENPKDWRNFIFFDLSNNSDILGRVAAYMENTGTPLQDLRLFKFETKKQFEAMRQEWTKRADWSIGIDKK